MVSMVMGVVKGQIELPGWEAITALLGLPAFVLRSYFNNRTQDKKTRAAAGLGINPNTPSTLDKVIGALAAKYLKVDIDKST